MRVQAILKGFACWIPGVSLLVSRAARDESRSARYYYSCWLRHLVRAHEAGFSTPPESVVEIGPGLSLGTGLAALLSGVGRYSALDVVKYAGAQRDRVMLAELIDMFRKREALPGKDEFPRLKPVVESYEFPSDMVKGNSLDSDRLRATEKALLHLGVPAESGESMISYLAPWSCPGIIKHESVDMVLSQAVLEHVEELSAVHKAIHGWLKPGGFVSHTIDLTSHGTSRNWNGHWACSDRMWKLIKGRRPYFLNRKTCSEHLDEIRNAGFDIVREMRTTDLAGITRARLAPGFRAMVDDDLHTSHVFVQAVKLSRR